MGVTPSAPRRVTLSSYFKFFYCGAPLSQRTGLWGWLGSCHITNYILVANNCKVAAGSIVTLNFQLEVRSWCLKSAGLSFLQFLCRWVWTTSKTHKFCERYEGNSKPPLQWSIPNININMFPTQSIKEEAKSRKLKGFGFAHTLVLICWWGWSMLTRGNWHHHQSVLGVPPNTFFGQNINSSFQGKWFFGHISHLLAQNGHFLPRYPVKWPKPHWPADALLGSRKKKSVKFQTLCYKVTKRKGSNYNLNILVKITNNYLYLY